MQVQGKTIAITRPAEDAMEFISLMESHGGQVIPLRTIEVAASTETIGPGNFSHRVLQNY